MKLSVSISGHAEADLSNQYRWYMANAGFDVAERYLAAFDTTVQKLAKLPGIGRRPRFRSPELAGIRSFPVTGRFGTHLIFYRADRNSLTIERVMHGARDLPGRLLEPPESPALGETK